MARRLAILENVSLAVIFHAASIAPIIRGTQPVMPRPARTVRDRIHLTVFDGRP